MNTETIITVKTTKGDRQVLALVYGTWAVHHEFDYKIRRSKRWSITHVKTGLAIPEFYTEDLSKLTAIKVAKVLNEKHPNPGLDKESGNAVVETLWRVALGGKP